MSTPRANSGSSSAAQLALASALVSAGAALVVMVSVVAGQPLGVVALMAAGGAAVAAALAGLAYVRLARSTGAEASTATSLAVSTNELPMAALAPPGARPALPAPVDAAPPAAEPGSMVSPDTALAAVVDADQIGLFEWDVPNDVVRVNDHLLRWLGLGQDDPSNPSAETERELLGGLSMQRWIGWVHPQDASPLWEAIKRHFDGHEPRFRANARLRHTDGHWVAMVVAGKAVERTAEGLPCQVVATHHLADPSEGLVAAVPDTAAGLPVTGDARALSVVAGSRLPALHPQPRPQPHTQPRPQSATRDPDAVAERLVLMQRLAQHLRPSVRTVLGLADVLVSADGVKHEPRITAANLQTAARALDAAVEELLDLARAEAGQLRLETTDLVLAPLVEAVCDRLSASAAARDVQLHVHLPTNPVEPVDRIHGDADRVRQVVAHLVERAIRRSAAAAAPMASSLGGGRAAHPAEVRVRVQRVSASRPPGDTPHGPLLPALREQQTLYVEVQDNGPSAGTVSTDSVFSPWSAALSEDTASEAPLGLALARWLVEHMGGRIEVSSRQGLGQTVRVWWAAPTGVPDTAAPGARLDAARVVVVEGADLPSAELKSWLTQQGAYVQRCASLSGVVAAIARLRGIDAAANTAEPVLVIQDDSADPSEPWGTVVAESDDGSAAASGHDATAVRHLLVGRGRRTSLRRASDAVGLIDVLRRQVFVDAVAVMLGRMPSTPTPVAEWLDGFGGMATPSAGSAAPVTISDSAANDWLLGARVPPPTALQARERGQLVLVVEPEPMARAVLTRQLALLGYASEAVGSTVEALQAWQRDPQALALVSLQMQGDVAFAWADDVRRHEREQGMGRMPIVAVTSQSSPVEAARSRACGMDDVLVRPVALLGLLACLNQWMPAPRRRVSERDGMSDYGDADNAHGTAPGSLAGFVPIGVAPAGWDARAGLGPQALPLLPPLPPLFSIHDSPPTLPSRLDPPVGGPAAGASAGPAADASPDNAARLQLLPARLAVTGASSAAYVLDLDALRKLVGDNDNVVRELLLDYLQLAGRHARDLREAVQARDAARLAWVARQFKGVSRAVGAAELVDVCTAMEALGSDTSALAQHLPWFDRAFSAVCGRIDDALRSASP